jgi:hypothetical protein
MKVLTTAFASAAIAASLLTGVAAAADGRGHTVTIGGSAIEPAAIRVALHERVVFLNRSGRGIHVDFHGPRGEHHVVHVPSTVWAEFHWPGRHPYVVHFSTGQPAELHAVVEVDYGPPLTPTIECGGFTVEETCIER